MSSKFLPPSLQPPPTEKCAFLNHVEEYAKAGQATDDNIIRRRKYVIFGRITTRVLISP